MIIGERVKQTRISKGYTQEELGNLLGVSKVSICGYEKGTRTPSTDMLVKLTETLGITIDYLFGNDIKAVNENNEPYTMSIAKEDIAILKELKNNNVLYNRLCRDPKRTIQLINRKLK